MFDFRFACPHCQKTIAGKGKKIPKQITCPACGKVFATEGAEVRPKSSASSSISKMKSPSSRAGQSSVTKRLELGSVPGVSPPGGLMRSPGKKKDSPFVLAAIGAGGITLIVVVILFFMAKRPPVPQIPSSLAVHAPVLPVEPPRPPSHVGEWTPPVPQMPPGAFSPPIPPGAYGPPMPPGAIGPPVPPGAYAPPGPFGPPPRTQPEIAATPIQYKWEKGVAYLYEGTVKFDFFGESQMETDIKSYFCINPMESIKYPGPAIEAVDRGMAFPLDHKGHFITVEPAVRDVTDANLSFSLGGTSHQIKRIAVDAARGLALLKVEPSPAVVVPLWKMVSVGPAEEFFVDHPGLFDYVRGEQTWAKKSSAWLNSDPHDTLKETQFYRVFSEEPLAGVPCLMSGTGYVIGIGYTEIPPQETGSVIHISSFPPYGVIPTKTVSAFLKEHKLELPLALGAAKSEMPGSSIAQLLERKEIDGVDSTVTQRSVLTHGLIIREPGSERFNNVDAKILHRDEFGRVLPPEEKPHCHLLHLNPRPFYDEFLAELPRRQDVPTSSEDEFPIAELRRENCFFGLTPALKDLPEIIATNQKLFVSKVDLFDSSNPSKIVVRSRRFSRIGPNKDADPLLMEGLEREMEFDPVEGVPRRITVALVFGYKINGNEKQISYASSLEFIRKETFQEFVAKMEQEAVRSPSVAASGPPPEAINPEEIDDAADEPANTPPVEEVEPEIPPPPPSPVKRFETPVTRQNLKQCLAVITDENSGSDELNQALMALRFFRDATGAQKKEIADSMRLHLRAEDTLVRSTALNLLVHYGGESAVKDLAELLDSRDSSLVHSAVRSLEKIKTKESAQALADKLEKSDDRDIFYFESALRNMKKVAEGPVLPLLEHEEPEIRTSACKILGEVGGKESYEKLKTLANDDSSVKVRQASREALTKIEQRREN